METEIVKYKLTRKKGFTDCYGNRHDVIDSSYNSQTDTLSTLYCTRIQIIRLKSIKWGWLRVVYERIRKATNNRQQKTFSSFLLSFPITSLFSDYATKNRKTIRKNISTKKILIINHLFEDMLFRYLSKAPCAPSTFARESSIFSSILQ